MHKNSQTTPKVKSKIEIIHIFEPQIIKTDAAHFKELVQKLTGKPKNDGDEKKSTSKSIEPISNNNFQSNKKICNDAADQGFREKIKREEEIWREANQGFRVKIKGEEEIWREANTGSEFFEFGDDHEFLPEMGSNIHNHPYFPYLEGTTDYHGWCF
ncbi:hypothetical protein CASFOL_032604 [Castilleja foliolosa]|uniref:VQ domain-containing protein n=1 Tax=Castilleja foliolosa TaxID=1961234 RepID=A0ABD3C1Y5_9LAMI